MLPIDPMRVHSSTLKLRTRGEVDIRDLTRAVEEAVEASGVRQGTVTVFTKSSTSAITTMEFEPGLEGDMAEALERLFPRGLDYGHERRWHDGNGHSHVRASFLGPSLTVPILDGKPALGTWQQVVLVELDNKPREREVVIQVIG